MKTAFTFTELIFVIVVIGLLSAVAIPKYQSLKQNAKTRALIDTCISAVKLAAQTGSNWKYLEDKKWDPHCNNINYPDSSRWKNFFCLKNLITLPSNWRYDMTTNAEYYSYPNLRYYIVSVEINSTNAICRINCDRFQDEKEKSECVAFLNGNRSDSIILNW